MRSSENLKGIFRNSVCYAGKGKRPWLKGYGTSKMVREEGKKDERVELRFHEINQGISHVDRIQMSDFGVKKYVIVVTFHRKD